jgi:hypothetical protein
MKKYSSILIMAIVVFIVMIYMPPGTQLCIDLPPSDMRFCVTSALVRIPPVESALPDIPLHSDLGK